MVRLRTCIGIEHCPLVNAMSVSSSCPVERYRCADEDAVEQRRHSIGADHSDHDPHHLLKPFRNENALILSEDRKLDGGKGDVIDPEAEPEVFEKAFEILGRNLIDMSSKAVTSFYG